MEAKLLNWLTNLMDIIDRSRQRNGLLYLIFLIATSFFVYVAALSHVINAVLAIVFVIFLFITTTKPKYEIGFPQQTSLEAVLKTKPQNWWLAFTTGFMWLSLQLVITWLITGKSFEWTHLADTMSMTRIFAVICVSPIIEEVIYRRTLYSNMLQRKGKAKALIISIVVFTLIHLPTSPLMALQYVLGSCALFSVYHYSNEDLRASVLFHIINNIIAIL